MEAFLQGSFGQIVLGPGVVTIGRALDNRLVVNNPIASSHHAQIRPEGDGYRLNDLGSTNGTFVNEQPVNPHFPHLLRAGDRIRIADMTFLYETGRPPFQSSFAQNNGYKDTPTARMPAIGYSTFTQSEQFGDQPPTPYFTSTLAHPVSPTFEQSNIPTLATDNTYGMSATVQPQPFESTPAHSQPAQRKSNTWLKVLLLCLTIVILLGSIGGGITAYLLTRPKPVMTVISDFLVGSTPAGSNGTVLHISAHSFSGSSAIIFLFDNQPVASKQQVTSDANGSVKIDLTITDSWALGNHKLTAKDASGYMTKVGVPVVIVLQGQADTPGPNGSPADDRTFSLDGSVRVQDAGTGKQIGTYAVSLGIIGRSDPYGGIVCQSTDHGQTNTYLGNVGNGITYREVYVFSCSGAYKRGKLSYIETATSTKIIYSDGLTCMAHTPFVSEDLEGTFTSQNTISGTMSGDSITWDCGRVMGTQIANASKGTWTARL